MPFNQSNRKHTIVALNIMYDLHNVINLSVDVSHVLVLSYYLVNNKICLRQHKHNVVRLVWDFDGLHFSWYILIIQCDIDYKHT